MKRLMILTLMAALGLPPLVGALDVEQLSVMSIDQRCEVDDDCVIVSTDCSTCECGAPINRIYEQVYIERYQVLCENYRGGVCEFYCRTPFAACENNQCVLSASRPETGATATRETNARLGETAALQAAMQFWREQYGVSEGDFIFGPPEIQDIGQTWRVWAVTEGHVMPPLEVQVDKVTGEVSDVPRE